MNSSQLLSGLPMQLFKDLISRPRALALRSLTADGVATAADDDDVDVETSADDDIPTGLPTLDSSLLGGFPLCSISELVGRAGVGKTHLAQQLCVLAAKSGFGGAVYIDTEKKLSLVRLRELAMERNTMQRLPVKLVVIDSIAAPVRRDFDMMSSSSTSKFSPNAATQRASFIFQVARKLKQLTHDHHLAVVVVNQVGSGGSDFRNNNPQRNNTLDIRDGEFTASLGTAWQYCVTTRIVMEHEDDPHKLAQEQDQCHQRKATITKSLVSKRAEVAFQLTSQGLCEV
ncbi:hypothetical protein THAPSDRAFT_261577 [Thalassiosira pseudonana CCMP1335]